jgi:hypothetical protein
MRFTVAIPGIGALAGFAAARQPDPDQHGGAPRADAERMKTDPLRQKLSESDLLALLNWELSAYEECAGDHFTAVTPASGGEDCNWSDARLESDHVLGADEERITHLVVDETKRRYDVALH